VQDFIFFMDKTRNIQVTTANKHLFRSLPCEQLGFKDDTAYMHPMVSAATPAALHDIACVSPPTQVQGYLGWQTKSYDVQFDVKTFYVDCLD
jgi:hypothetical protein